MGLRLSEFSDGRSDTSDDSGAFFRTLKSSTGDGTQMTRGATDTTTGDRTWKSYVEARREDARGQATRGLRGAVETTKPVLADEGDVVGKGKGIARKRASQVTAMGSCRPSYIERRPCFMPNRAQFTRGMMMC
jgi:hypothetical protein